MSDLLCPHCGDVSQIAALESALDERDATIAELAHGFVTWYWTNVDDLPDTIATGEIGLTVVDYQLAHVTTKELVAELLRFLRSAPWEATTDA